MQYYKIPLSPLDLFKNKTLKKYPELMESIGANIDLILTTSFGEYASDETYGCSIWDNDFENISGNDRWKEQLNRSIKKSIQQHEPRLMNVAISTEIIQDEVKYNNINRMKRRIDIVVEGNIVLTNEPFCGRTKLYVSPISLD